MIELGVGLSVLHIFSGSGLWCGKGCISSGTTMSLLSFLQQWATNRLLDCMALGSSTSGSSQVSFSKLPMGLEWE